MSDWSANRGVHMTTHATPTYEEIRSNAYRMLGDVQDELRSDWQPGTGPAGDDVMKHIALTEAREYIAKAKDALNEAAL